MMFHESPYKNTSVSAERIEVIRVTSTIGEGTERDPYRRLISYFSLSGELLAAYDEWAEEQPLLRGMPSVHGTVGGES